MPGSLRQPWPLVKAISSDQGGVQHDLKRRLDAKPSQSACPRRERGASLLEARHHRCKSAFKDGTQELSRPGIRGIFEHLRRRPLLNDLASIKHEHAVGNVGGKANLMGDDKH